MPAHYRITYAKTASMRYTGGLDVQRSWERTLRRARLPVAYSQGFHPQPRLQQAAPLPLGFTGLAEVMDAWLEQELDAGEVTLALQQAAPPGIEDIRVAVVDGKTPPLQTQLLSAEYETVLLVPPDGFELARQVETLLSAPELPRVWREKRYDLRPLVEALELRQAEEDRWPRLWMRLAAREGATGRPEEVLAALGLDPLEARVERTQLIFQAS